MRAQFHLAADLDVVVSNDEIGRRVNLQVFRGVCYETGHSRHTLLPEGEAGQEKVLDCPERTVDSVTLARNEARAIASALMGCAAE